MHFNREMLKRTGFQDSNDICYIGGMSGNGVDYE